MKLARIACGWLAAGSLALGYQAVPMPPMPPMGPAYASIQTGTGRGSIEGQVVNLATGQPLKRATVRVVGIGRRPEGGMPAMANKETDEQGRFAFLNLDSGKYQISVERQGFLKQNYGQRKYSNGGTPLALGKDQNIRDVLFKMNPQSVITGKVLDDDGEPVANTQVRAHKMAYRSGKKQWVQAGNGQTSDIGEFRIPNLDPGRYIVSANPNRNQNMMQTASNEPLPQNELVFATTYYPSATDSSIAVPVDVPAGNEIRGIDVRLRRTRVFRVRGVLSGVTGGRGQAMVMLSPKENMGGPQAMGPARPPDNRFEIRGVMPGSYILHTEPRGGNQQQMVAYIPLEITGNHVDGVVLSVVPGADIPFSVKIEDANGPLTMSNLQVNLQPTFPMGGAPRGKVGENLTGVLKNVVPMKYRINVGGIPEGSFLKSVRYGGLEVPEDGIDMFSPAPIEITISATAGDISAAVVDKDGKPVPNALVALLPKDGKSTRANTSDDAGGVYFRGLKPGDYRIMAFEDIPPGAYQDPDFIKPFEGTAATVKLDPSGKQSVQLKLIPMSETDK